MNNKWQIGIATHRGTKKIKNEDSHLSLMVSDHEGNELALFVVADGMGGYEIGDVASQLAVTTIKSWWDKRISKILKRKNVLERLTQEAKQTLEKINTLIISTGQKRKKKMGTTASLLALYKGEYAVIHIGDSRIYHMNANSEQTQLLEKLSHFQVKDEQTTELLEPIPQLQQLSVDHSWVEEQVRKGQLTPEKAQNHPRKNVLMQCLGIKENIAPYTSSGSYQPSDLFLVCSDGFHVLFTDDDIQNMLINLEKEYRNLQMVCDYLINFSNFSAAYDNVTLMLVRHTYTFNESFKKSNPLRSLLKMIK